MSNRMEPNLLMRAWMVVHLRGAELQALVCSGGSDGEAAFRESLEPQYTSDRHDAKGLTSFYITGTCDKIPISRIASTRIDAGLGGVDGRPLQITVTSNIQSWKEDGDLSNITYITSLDLHMGRLTQISDSFVEGSFILQHINLNSLRNITIIPLGFLSDCVSLKEIDLSPLVNVKEVGSGFLFNCTALESINLAPFRAVEVIPEGFLQGCSSLREVDLSPLVHVKEICPYILNSCTSLTALDLTPLHAIQVIPYCFLNGCSALEVVDFRNLVNVTEVGSLHG